MTAQPSARASGFTLIELIIVIVLTGILAAASVQPLVQTLSMRTGVDNNLKTIDNLSYATERMVRELRQTYFDPIGGTGFQLQPLNVTSSSGNTSGGICFQRAGGSDGKNLATIALRRSGSMISFDAATNFPGCTAVNPQTLADNATALQFTYWTYGSGTQATALAIGDPGFTKKLHFIDITVSLANSSGAQVSHTTRVVLRNGAWGAAK